MGKEGEKEAEFPGEETDLFITAVIMPRKCANLHKLIMKSIKPDSLKKITPNKAHTASKPHYICELDPIDKTHINHHTKKAASSISAFEGKINTLPAACSVLCL